MTRRGALLLLALSALACSSSSAPTPHGPGTTPPGEACATADDCGCWTCACQGVGGAPGAAQLCVSGVCPTGEEACAPSCAAADAGVVSAASSPMCNGVP